MEAEGLDGVMYQYEFPDFDGNSLVRYENVLVCKRNILPYSVMISCQQLTFKRFQEGKKEFFVQYL